MLSAIQLKFAFPLEATVILADEDYVEPELNWLLGEFWDWFQRRRWGLGLHKWDRRNDCDNFARAYAQACEDCWALTTAGGPQGIAVGEYYYVKNGGGRHAINCAFTDQGRIFIEPQTGATIRLSQQEFDSCFFVRF